MKHLFIKLYTIDVSNVVAGNFYTVEKHHLPYLDLRISFIFCSRSTLFNFSFSSSCFRVSTFISSRSFLNSSSVSNTQRKQFNCMIEGLRRLLLTSGNELGDHQQA